MNTIKQLKPLRLMILEAQPLIMYTQINIIIVGIISLGKESIHAVVHLLHSSSKKYVSLGDRCPHQFSVLALLSTFSETIQFSGALSLSTRI